MKLYLIACFLLTSFLSLAQETDSLSVDSSRFDSTMFAFPDGFDLFTVIEYDQPKVMVTVPNCAQLYSASGKLYWYQSKSKKPYCGFYFVRENADKSNITIESSEYFVDNLWLNNLDITIISHYSNGKRDGERLYFKREGSKVSKWKVEYYEDGLLVRTNFYD